MFKLAGLKRFTRDAADGVFKIAAADSPSFSSYLPMQVISYLEKN
jgi:hypothetical protein